MQFCPEAKMNMCVDISWWCLQYYWVINMCWVLINCCASLFGSNEQKDHTKVPKARVEMHGSSLQQMDLIQDAIASRVPPKKCGISMYQTHSGNNLRVLFFNNGESYQLFDGSSDDVSIQHIASRVEQSLLWGTSSDLNEVVSWN